MEIGSRCEEWRALVEMATDTSNIASDRAKKESESLEPG